MPYDLVTRTNYWRHPLMWEGKPSKEKDKKNWLKPKWQPQFESKYYLGASIGGMDNMEIYFTYDLITLLLTKVVHSGDFPVTMTFKDDKIYNLDNEEVNISDLLIYMEDDKNGNLFPDPEISYNCSKGEV
jgi:hypothetical protein